MRLADLEPKWLIKDGRRVGFIFRSPTNSAWFQSCMLEIMPRREQFALLAAARPEQSEDGEPYDIQPCRPDFAWTISPVAEQADFANLTIMPSIDGSPGGLWHGFITNGEIR